MDEDGAVVVVLGSVLVDSNPNSHRSRLPVVVYALNWFMISPVFFELLFAFPQNVGLRSGKHNVHTTGDCVFCDEKP